MAWTNQGKGLQHHIGRHNRTTDLLNRTAGQDNCKQNSLPELPNKTVCQNCPTKQPARTTQQNILPDCPTELPNRIVQHTEPKKKIRASELSNRALLQQTPFDSLRVIAPVFTFVYPQTVDCHDCENFEGLTQTFWTYTTCWNLLDLLELADTAWVLTLHCTSLS